MNSFIHSYIYLLFRVEVDLEPISGKTMHEPEIHHESSPWLKAALEHVPEEPLESQVFPLLSHILASVLHLMNEPSKIKQVSKGFSSMAWIIWVLSSSQVAQQKITQRSRVRILRMPQPPIARRPREQNWPCRLGRRNGMLSGTLANCRHLLATYPM